MAESGKESNPSCSRVLRRVGVAGLSIAPIFYLATQFAGNARSELLAEIEAFGAPTSFESLEGWYPEPKLVDNAGLSVIEAFRNSMKAG